MTTHEHIREYLTSRQDPQSIMLIKSICEFDNYMDGENIDLEDIRESLRKSITKN